MLLGLFVLLSCQLLGEILVRGLGLPIPGPVIGIVLLSVWLMIVGRGRTGAVESGDTAKAADGLLANLGLVFVPAGVGISQHYELIVSNGIALLAALIVSTVLTLVVTVLVFRAVSVRTTAKAKLP